MLRQVFVAILAVTLVAAPALALAASSPAAIPAEHVRLFYYRDSPKALASLKKNYRSIDVLAPQSYRLDGAGNLTGEPPKKALRFAKTKGIAVVPLVTNGAFDAAAVSIFLEDSEARTEAISAMVTEAEKRGYAGWQIDFEQMNVSLRDHFSAFVGEAATAMRVGGLFLSVAVVSKISDNPSDYPNDLWQNLIGVFDYAALGESADFVSLMSYDEPYKTGPVAPYPWLLRVLDYALDKIPPEKISLGIPLYYWEREDKPLGRIMEIGGASGIAEAKQERRAKTGYDETMETAFVRYSAAKKDSRVVWFENRRSIEAKLNLANLHSLHGISAWALGLELPETHRAFAGWGR
ncbi:MAG TPA: glycosyl hydrolase family 18 protein [Candidatus Paceibacterota bacterium]